MYQWPRRHVNELEGFAGWYVNTDYTTDSQTPRFPKCFDDKKRIILNTSWEYILIVWWFDTKFNGSSEPLPAHPSLVLGGVWRLQRACKHEDLPRQKREPKETNVWNHTISHEMDHGEQCNPETKSTANTHRSSDSSTSHPSSNGSPRSSRYWYQYPAWPVFRLKSCIPWNISWAIFSKRLEAPYWVIAIVISLAFWHSQETTVDKP